MKEIERSRLTRRRKVRPYQGRGPIYAWLRAHHASIEKLAAARPCIWAELALDMIEDGVVDGTGDPPTAHNIRMTWPRVCRDVAAEVVAAKPKRVPPSRISPDWRPTVVPQRAAAPAQQPASPARAVVPSGRKSLVDPNDHPLVQAEMAKLEAIFDEDEKRRLPR